MPFKADALLNKVFSNVPILNFFTKPIINKIKDTKIFYSPEKISTSLGVSDDYQLKIMRQGLDTTETKRIDVNRSMTITQKVFDNFQTNYKIVIASDVYSEMQKNDFGNAKIVGQGQVPFPQPNKNAVNVENPRVANKRNAEKRFWPFWP